MTKYTTTQAREIFKSAGSLNDIISSTDTLFGYFGNIFYQALSFMRDEFNQVLSESEEIEEPMKYFNKIYSNGGGHLGDIMPDEVKTYGEAVKKFNFNLEKLREIKRNLQKYEKEQIKKSRLQ